MRKFLGLLLAVVFVTAAAGSAMAARTVSLSSTTGTLLGLFSAEHSFIQTGNATFGFDLFRMAANKPADGDAEAEKIDWQGVADIKAGSDTFKASKVYAKITNQAYTVGTIVMLYTDNANKAGATLPEGAYLYTLTSTNTAYNIGSSQTINALVEKGGSGMTSSGNNTLPLSFRIEQKALVDDGAYDVTTANFSDNGNTSEALGVTGGALFYVTDKSKAAKPASGTEGQPGYDPASGAFDEEYATISKTAGMKIWSTYDRADVNDWYFFFASNFARARAGHSYGTDTLTVELVVTP
ncbi:MAG: hypothetical protein LBR69_04515 [Endomicrobium sp.]|jgi:hypothetical protein|nr:hypothetical protein [Endomicrobium sp.]